MKKLVELTITDLDANPIWRHEGGSDDVARVTPCIDFHNPNMNGYIAKTIFTAANGKQFFGFCSPQDPSGLDYIQPVIILGNRHIRLWDEMVGLETNQNIVTKLLGLKVSDTFPLKYRTLVPFEGEYWEGTIE